MTAMLRACLGIGTGRPARRRGRAPTAPHMQVEVQAKGQLPILLNQVHF